MSRPRLTEQQEWRELLDAERRERDIAAAIADDAASHQPSMSERQLWRYYKSSKTVEEFAIARAIANHPNIPRRFAMRAVRVEEVVSPHFFMAGMTNRTVQQNVDLLHAIIDNPATPTRALDNFYWVYKNLYPNVIRNLVGNRAASSEIIDDIFSVFATGSASDATVQTIQWIIGESARHPHMTSRSAKNLIVGVNRVLDEQENPNLIRSDFTLCRHVCRVLAPLVLDSEWKFSSVSDEQTRSRLVMTLALS